MMKTIASIYPIALTAKRPLYAGDFHIPAVQRGDKPSLLEVKDHYQIETEPWFKGTTGAGRQKQSRITIAGEEIARDIIAEWTENHPDAGPDCHPGVWIVRDSIPLFEEKNGRQVPLADADGKQAFRSATKEERDQMFAEDLKRIEEVQANWGEKAFLKGNLMADDPKKIPWIPEYCKTMAKHYGHSPAWLNRASDSNVKVCPACRKQIAAQAWKCGFCQEIVDPQAAAKHRQNVKQAVA